MVSLGSGASEIRSGLAYIRQRSHCERMFDERRAKLARCLPHTWTGAWLELYLCHRSWRSAGPTFELLVRRPQRPVRFASSQLLSLAGSREGREQPGTLSCLAPRLKAYGPNPFAWPAGGRLLRGLLAVLQLHLQLDSRAPIWSL